MLLKYQQAQKRIKTSGIGKPQRTAGGMVRLTSGAMTVVPKIHRRVVRVASKRPSAIHRPAPVKREQIPIDPCENSNDSGLGFDHHSDYHGHTNLAPLPHPLTLSTLRFSDKETVWPTDEPPEVKRRRLEIKLESDDANDNFTFPETVRQQPPPPPRPVCVAVRGRSRGLPITLNSQLTATTSDGRTQLIIACQPEQQHRARYQTEGSRGAVKDRTGNGFPVVKLVGYDRPAVLQVFIGTDQGRVAPHMFYQACRVSGKNSTPCVEKKIDGTIVIEVDMEPAKDMVVTCDCVGILKERNVDVEHRFPEESSGRSKKKSTRCRMVFRTTILLPDGSQETLQATSQPIVCTQPPGVPEICKKSLTSCNVRGGLELFILGKNFLKDTKVVFQEGEWEQKVQPDKEFLQQSHLVCVVPAYERTDIAEPVAVRLVVESSGKASEPHTFTYLPSPPGDNAEHNSPVLGLDGSVTHNHLTSGLVNAGGFRGHPSLTPLLLQSEPVTHFLAAQTSPRAEDKLRPVLCPSMWEKSAEVLMPPPAPALLPIPVRRSSVQMMVPELAPEDLKKETPEAVEPPKQMANVSDLSSAPPPSIDTFHRFVSESSLPSINVSNYLSNIENKAVYTDKAVKTHLINEMPHIMIPPSSAVNKPMFSCNSANLLTTVEPQGNKQPSAVPFENRNISPENRRLREEQHMSVIVNSALLQEKSQDNQMMDSSCQMANSVKHEILMPTVIKQDTTGTERLDAFVNSAAESHISPNPTSSSQVNSVIAETSMMPSNNEIMMNGANDMTKFRDSHNSLGMATTLALNSSLQTGPSMSDSNCSFITNTPPQGSPDQTQLDMAVKSSPDNSMCVKHENIPQVHLVHSPTQLPLRQEQELASLQVALGQQLSQPASSSQALQNEINNLIQKQVQTSLEQQLSSPVVSSDQMNQNNLNTMLHSLPHCSSNQEQNLQDIKVSLEQQLPPQNIISNSTQMNNHQLANLIQATEQEIRNEVQTLNNLQASIEHHLASQNMAASQLVSEAEQASNLSMNNMRTSPVQPTISKAEVYSKIQASIQHELSNQMLASSQTSLEPLMVHSESVSPLNLASIRMENHLGSVAQNCTTNLQASLETHMSPQMIISTQMNNDPLVSGNGGLNPPIPTSPNHAQGSINPVQALSNLQASLDNFSTQVMNQTQSIIEATRSLSSSPNSSIESSQVSPNQSNIQMSLNQLSPPHVSPSQTNHGPMSLNQVPHVSIGQVSPEISSFQPTFEQQLRSEMMAAAHPETVLPLEHLHAPQTVNQAITMSSLTSSMIQTGHVDCVTSNNMSQMGVPQGMNLDNSVSLLTSQPLPNSTSQLSPDILSSTSSCQSVTTNLAPSEISLPQNNYSSEPLPCTIALTPSIQDNVQTVNITSPNLMLPTSQNILTSDSLINNNQSTLTISSLQNPSLQRTIQHGGTFEPATTPNMTSVQAQQQTSAPAVKKCEDGIPQVPSEITQMSEHDLISYINPSCFDTV